MIETIEFSADEAMTPGQRVMTCFSMIQEALKIYKCKLDVTAILRENGSDFDIKVIPEEGEL